MLRQWHALATWPVAAIGDLWSFLQPLIENPRGAGAGTALRVFCQRHGLGRAEVGEVGTVLHNLLLRAASIDLPPENFAQDLAALGGGDAAATLLDSYAAAKRTVRFRLLRTALADHGKVMTGVSWRVDQIGDSDAARQLATSVLMLTLNWREGETSGRTTLQLTPDAVADLRRVLQRFAV